MPASPVTDSTDLVTYSIKVNGSEINGEYQVTSIFVEQKVNKIPYCEIEILDGSPASEDFPISDSDTFVPGNSIEVQVGYENNDQTIFNGIIVQHTIRIKRGVGPVLVVICKDKAVKMTKGRKNAYFTNTTDSDILSQIIGQHGLTADVTSTSAQLKEVIQYYVSDWDFIVSRADINGLLVMVNNGTVSAKSPDDVTTEVLSLTYGTDIFEFEGEVDAENQFKTVKSSAWSIKNQSVSSQDHSLANFEAGNLSGTTLAEVLNVASYDLQSAGFLEDGILTSWAKAQSIKSKYAKARGTAKFQGNGSVMPGTLVTLSGVGKRFNGKGFVSGTKHEIESGNWTTTIELGMTSEWFAAEVKSEAPVAAGLIPGIQGFQIGKVKKINSDPDGELRVLIDLPLVGTGGDGVWARLASFYASSGFGAFFYPETDDEVIVGFFNDDPRYPVILGSLYSSARSASYTPDEKNNTKGFVSRTQMKLVFDEEKKVITILTPGNNSIVLSDDAKGITLSDQNNNSIKMSSSGIEISSASNITIKASQSMSVQASTGASVKVSGGDLSMEAVNVSCNGQMSLKAQGGVSAQFTASGELKIQGAMVMIN